MDGGIYLTPSLTNEVGLPDCFWLSLQDWTGNGSNIGSVAPAYIGSTFQAQGNSGKRRGEGKEGGSELWAFLDSINLSFPADKKWKPTFAWDQQTVFAYVTKEEEQEE